MCCCLPAPFSHLLTTQHLCPVRFQPPRTSSQAEIMVCGMTESASALIMSLQLLQGSNHISGLYKLPRVWWFVTVAQPRTCKYECMKTVAALLCCLSPWQKPETSKKRRPQPKNRVDRVGHSSCLWDSLLTTDWCVCVCGGRVSTL